MVNREGDSKIEPDVLVNSKKESNNASFLNIALLIIIIVALAIIFYLHVRLKKCEAGQGKRANYLNAKKFFSLDLLPVDDEEKPVDFSKDLYLLFCFKSDCSQCLSNRDVWTQLATYWEGKAEKIKMLGILPIGIDEARLFQQKEHFPFSLYVPREVDAYLQNMQLTTNAEYTILIFKKKIIMSKMGDLSAQDLLHLISTIKEKIQTME